MHDRHGVSRDHSRMQSGAVIIAVLKIALAAIVALPIAFAIYFALIVTWESTFGPCPGRWLAFDSTGCPSP